ncbi:hypothetical protein LCGC14_2329850 [marine sediment metagenome]|uniref:Uncharacterized protein n=1 Tax=marine sediment metagenome TaxID=412755 RepID=A0A0F9FA83_9ZZZZ
MKPTPYPWIYDKRARLIYSHGPSRGLTGDTKDCPVVVEVKDLFNINDAPLIAAAPTIFEHLRYIESAISTYCLANLDEDEVISINITVKAAKDLVKTITNIVTGGE